MRIGGPGRRRAGRGGLRAEATSPRDLLRRFLQGDLASLRVILAIALIWIIFELQNDRFLSATNLTNLFLQITPVGLISVGVVLVLLLGEIDLSVGAVSGLAAAVMAVLNVKHGWSPYPAIAAARRWRAGDRPAPGAPLHPLPDSLVRRHPGRAARLAGRAPAGPRADRHGQPQQLGDHRPRQHLLLGRGRLDLRRGSRSAPSPWSPWAGTGAALAAGRHDRADRVAAARIAVVAVVAIVAIAILNSDRGLPLALLILLAFVIGFQLLDHADRRSAATSSRSAAAPRPRAAPGIRVDGIRVIAFMLCSARWRRSAASSPPRACSPSTRAPAAANCCCWRSPAPVIAGTSLFGGRGSVWSALLGALVIGSISNGMDLLALESSAVKFMVTGGVLLRR